MNDYTRIEQIDSPRSVEQITLTKAHRHAIEYLEGLERRSVAGTASLEQLRLRLGGAVPADGTPSGNVIDDLVSCASGGLLGCAGGRFFAWVIGGSLPAALGADWLTSVWDQNAAVYACSPAAALVEEIAGEWLKDLLELPHEASFAFTSGCQMAHFTCLAAARFALLKKVGWDLNDEGLFNAPNIRVIASDQRHASVDRALRFLGFGNRSITTVPSDENGQIDIDRVAKSLSAVQTPTIVVLNAADLNIGAFDPFAKVIPLGKAAGAWIHVDGAFGLVARVSEAKRGLLDGVEDADSWATDAHKWLNVPFDCGVAFVRDKEAHRASMTTHASYIASEEKARDQMDWNPEWSRRARGFTVYAALRELGRSGLKELVDRCCRHASALVKGIGALPGAEILWEPTLNQGLVRFLNPSSNASTEQHNARTDAVIAAVNATGEAFFSGTTFRGKRAMRVSVINWRTSEADVQRTIAAVRSVLLAQSRES